MSQTIQEVKARYQDKLMSLPGVVSIGIGRDEDGNDVIVIGVDGKQPLPSARIPEKLDEYPVVTRIVGPVSAQ